MKSKAIAVPTKSVAMFSPDTRAIIDRPTPATEIDKRPDGFSYVRIGYVRRLLDEAFGGLWSVESEVQTPELINLTGNLVVKVRLTVGDPATGLTLTKEAYGGGPIKLFKGTTKPVDLANDFKSAEADALKKAASLFGFCSDVYEPVVEQREQAREEEAKQASVVEETLAKLDPEATIDRQMFDFIMAKAQRHSVPGKMVEEFVKTTLKHEKFNQVLNKELNAIEKFIEAYGK